MIFLGGAANLFSSTVAGKYLTNYSKISGGKVATRLNQAFTQGGAIFALEVQIDTRSAMALTRAIFDTLKDKAYMNGFLELAAMEAMYIIENMLKPISRTGNTGRNWTYKFDKTRSDSVSIFPDDNNPAARAIEKGIYHASGKRPPIRKLTDWMDTKADLAGLSDREKSKMAYFVGKKIAQQRRPGPKSTLAGLKIFGMRNFKYIEDATAYLEQDVETAMDQLAQEIDRL